MGPVFLFDRTGGLAAWIRLRRELHRWQPDWTMDAQGNWKSAWVTRLSGANRRLGFHKRDWQEPLASWVLTEQAVQARGKHCIERVHQLVQHIAPGCNASPHHLPLTTQVRAEGAASLNKRLPDRGQPRRLIHPGRQGDPRSLPLDNLEQMIRTLTQAGEDVLLISGPAETSSGEKLAQRLAAVDGVQHWINKRGLQHYAAFFAAARDEGLRLAVGDSGPAHLAAAVNLGVDLWVGPTDACATGPWPLVSSPDTIHTAHRSPSGNISDLRGEQLAQSLLESVLCP